MLDPICCPSRVDRFLADAAVEPIEPEEPQKTVKQIREIEQELEACLNVKRPSNFWSR